MLLTYLFVFENSLDSSDLLLLAAVAEDAQTPEIGVLKNISKDDIYIDKRFQTSLTLISFAISMVKFKENYHEISYLKFQLILMSYEREIKNLGEEFTYKKNSVEIILLNWIVL